MRRRLYLLLLVALPLAPSCAARQVGKEAASGAVTGARQEDVGALSGKVAHEMAEGFLEELSKPEQQEKLRRIAAATVAGAMEGAAGQAPRAQRGVGGSGVASARSGTGPATTAASAFAQQMGTGLADAIAQRIEAHLGNGEGPLAAGMSATARDVAGAMVSGAAGEAARIFPECQGQPSCVSQKLETLSRSMGKQVALGMREGLGIWPFVLAFGTGVLLTALVAWAMSMSRSLKRAGRGEASARA